MRLALIAGVSPRKIGSFEDWLVAMCGAARDRGHRVEVFVHEPVHPEVRSRLEERSVKCTPISELQRSPPAAVFRLARTFDLVYLRLLAPRDRTALLAYAALPTLVVFADDFSGPPISQATSSPDTPRLLDRLTGMRWAGFVGVSEYVTGRDRARFGLARSRCRTIYNGVDPERFRPAAEGVEEGGPLHVLAAAYLIPEKGLDHLIEAVARLEDGEVRLTVAGDGPEAEDLERLSARLGLEDRVEFLGLRDDVDALMRDADVFVHPAVWEEAFGLTVAEAMASGCAVIATRVGGIPELIDHGRHGLLVDPGDAGSIARQLRRLAGNPRLRARLGEAARRRAEERFTLERCVGKTLGFCESLLES